MRSDSIIALLVATLMFAGVSQTSMANSTPTPKLRTIRDLVEFAPNKPMHIVYIHGIRTSAAGFSKHFQTSLCQRVMEKCGKPLEYHRNLDMGAPPDATFVGQAIWTRASWSYSQPFVQHYVYRRKNGAPVIVDEINYWPLLLPLKCQFIVSSDASLTGADRDDIETCATNDPANHLYPWIDAQSAQTLLNSPPASRGGAIVNRALKTGILNWGLSDAVITLGPMKYYTRLAVWCALEEIAEFDPDTAPPTQARSCRASDNTDIRSDQQFVIISESLGSFVLLDAFATAASDLRANEAGDSDDACKSKEHGGAALCYIVKRSDNIYFFANQFTLLELGRIQGMDRDGRNTETSRDEMKDALLEWARQDSRDRNLGPKQLVAFNDPSDILTENIPDFCGVMAAQNDCHAIFVNKYVRNGFDWFGIIEDPTTAHTTYSENPKVIDVILGR